MANAKLEFGSRKLTYVLLASIGAIACAVTAVEFVVRGKSADAALPKALSVESLKAQLDEPGKLMQTVRDNMRRDDLSDEQRRQVFRNAREVMRATMHERVDEYLNAPEDQKTAVLDQHIDDFLARMNAWEKARQQGEEEDGGESERDREWVRNAIAQMSQQDRKVRSESRDPDRMARAMAYFTAVRSRMQERSIEMPSRGGGRGSRGGRFGP